MVGPRAKATRVLQAKRKKYAKDLTRVSAPVVTDATMITNVQYMESSVMEHIFCWNGKDADQDGVNVSGVLAKANVDNK